MTMKRQLEQIKIFPYHNYTTEELEIAVNAYVIERFNNEGNFPRIETNEGFISVISECLVTTNLKSKD